MKNTLFLILIHFFIMSCSSEKSNSKINDLLGDWKLTAFINENTGVTQVENDFENSNPIHFEFKEDFKFLGTTILNDFFGNFSVNNSETVIIFLEYNTTEVNETEWGNLFYEKLNLNYNTETQHFENGFDINNSFLKLYYSEFEYMQFKKL
ncbi:MAG: hypothetical protein CVU03_12925 [Bacteroidetes bacterium HGW-Bacteroidetes-2]|nr:MAG: hypothetical protein CVU03_12925 [Bacteroidetes bacterium HGW-Bacteroidetes-2]